MKSLKHWNIYDIIFLILDSLFIGVSFADLTITSNFIYIIPLLLFLFSLIGIIKNNKK